MEHLASVRTQLELRLVVPGGPSLPVLAELAYSAGDPWAVSVAFQTGGDGPDASEGVVEWLFARQLLSDGVAGPQGEGDVRVWPSLNGTERVVHLGMSSPSGSALFEMARDDVVEFLQQTYVAVPTGSEPLVVDLDRELAGLLDGRLSGE